MNAANGGPKTAAALTKSQSSTEQFAVWIMYRRAGSEFAATRVFTTEDDAKAFRAQALARLLTPADATDLEVGPIMLPRQARGPRP